MILDIGAVLILGGFAAFCWRTYRTTEDSSVRAVSYALAILAALAAFYMAFIRHVFVTCISMW